MPRSSSVKCRGSSDPMCSTPSRLFPTTSGTPDIDRSPLWSSSGFKTASECTSSSTAGPRDAAIRPANPPPTGMRYPCRTSSSRPCAANASRWVPVASVSRTTAVSTPSTRRMTSSMRSTASSSATPVSSTSAIAAILLGTASGGGMTRTLRPRWSAGPVAAAPAARRAAPHVPRSRVAGADSPAAVRQVAP